MVSKLKSLGIAFYLPMIIVGCQQGGGGGGESTAMPPQNLISSTEKDYDTSNTQFTVACTLQSGSTSTQNSVPASQINTSSLLSIAAGGYSSPLTNPPSPTESPSLYPINCTLTLTQLAYLGDGGVSYEFSPTSLNNEITANVSIDANADTTVTTPTTLSPEIAIPYQGTNTNSSNLNTSVTLTNIPLPTPYNNNVLFLSWVVQANSAIVSDFTLNGSNAVPPSVMGMQKIINNINNDSENLSIEYMTDAGDLVNTLIDQSNDDANSIFSAQSTQDGLDSFYRNAPGIRCFMFVDGTANANQPIYGSGFGNFIAAPYFSSEQYNNYGYLEPTSWAQTDALFAAAESNPSFPRNFYTYEGHAQPTWTLSSGLPPYYMVDCASMNLFNYSTNTEGIDGYDLFFIFANDLDDQGNPTLANAYTVITVPAVKVPVVTVNLSGIPTSPNPLAPICLQSQSSPTTTFCTASTPTSSTSSISDVPLGTYNFIMPGYTCSPTTAAITTANIATANTVDLSITGPYSHNSNATMPTVACDLTGYSGTGTVIFTATTSTSEPILFQIGNSSLFTVDSSIAGEQSVTVSGVTYGTPATQLTPTYPPYNGSASYYCSVTLAGTTDGQTDTTVISSADLNGFVVTCVPNILASIQFTLSSTGSAVPPDTVVTQNASSLATYYITGTLLDGTAASGSTLANANVTCSTTSTYIQATTGAAAGTFLPCIVNGQGLAQNNVQLIASNPQATLTTTLTLNMVGGSEGNLIITSTSGGTIPIGIENIPVYPLTQSPNTLPLSQNVYATYISADGSTIEDVTSSTQWSLSSNTNNYVQLSTTPSPAIGPNNTATILGFGSNLVASYTPQSGTPLTTTAVVNIVDYSVYLLLGNPFTNSYAAEACVPGPNGVLLPSQCTTADANSTFPITSPRPGLPNVIAHGITLNHALNSLYTIDWFSGYIFYCNLSSAGIPQGCQNNFNTGTSSGYNFSLATNIVDLYFSASASNPSPSEFLIVYTYNTQGRLPYVVCQIDTSTGAPILNTQGQACTNTTISSGYLSLPAPASAYQIRTIQTYQDGTGQMWVALYFQSGNQAETSGTANIALCPVAPSSGLVDGPCIQDYRTSSVSPILPFSPSGTGVLAFNYANILCEPIPDVTVNQAPTSIVCEYPVQIADNTGDPNDTLVISRGGLYSYYSGQTNSTITTCPLFDINLSTLNTGAALSNLCQTTSNDGSIPWGSEENDIAVGD